MTTDPATPALDLPVDTTPIRDAARLYARAGFAPVPVHGVTGERCGCGNVDCSAVGKHPVGGNWQKRASSDVDATRELFASHTGNIGIVVGAAHLVIDIDYYADGAIGLASLPEMPPTLTSRSGSGQGEHRIFAFAPGQDPGEVTNRRVAPGVDVKTRTGQIVVAPSLHRSGNRYQWIDATPPAPLPDALYEQIRKRRVVPLRSVPTPTQTADDLRKRATAYMAKLPPAIAGSGGHAATFAAARAVFGWVAKGLDESTAWGLLVEHNARCSPPWSESELRHKFDSARKADRVPVFDDRPAAYSGARVPAAPGNTSPPEQDGDDWRARLIYQRSKSGLDKPAKHHENAVIVLRYCPAWRGRVAWDQHAQRVVVTAPPWHESSAPAASGDADSGPREWTDADTARLSTWIRREVMALDLGVAECERAVVIAAEANPVHPFRAWLDSLAWDGKPRLADWLRVCVGAPASAYASHVGTWWIVSAVARTYAPGCKADHVLILEGPQGIRKSSALRTLVGDRWFSDTPIDLSSKDAYLALQGRVVVELGELESLKRADSDRAKVFFSSPIDQFRPPYGRRTIAVPRGCVFAGSVNHSAYLTDDTGNRRYWPIACGLIDIDFLSQIREQLWAEAVALYRAGGRWWPQGADEIALCSGEQSERVEADGWEDTIRAWIEDREPVTTADVWAGALKGDIDKLDRRSEQRIGRVLRDAGLVRARVMRAGLRRWEYSAPGRGKD